VLRFTLLSTLLAAAGIAPAADQASVLGLVVGSAKEAELETLAAHSRARETSRETSRHTLGAIIKFDGDFGLPGLTSSTFIFAKAGYLEAAVLTLHRTRYVEIVDSLKAKYRLIEEVRPFVGNRQARFLSGEVEINATSPHMSFEMSVTYTTVAFRAQLAKTAEQEDASRKQAQGARL